MAKTAIHTVYRLADGSRVPSVTTFLGILNKPALMHWAWKMGCEGLDYRKVRDEAGEIGTLAHYLIMCKLLKQKPDVSEYSEDVQVRAGVCLKKFQDWVKAHTIKPILVEKYLVSEQYRFGGTPDLYAYIDDLATLVDVKTSGAIYDDYYAQVAAYEVLIIEQPQLPPVEDVRILRFGRSEDEGFEDRAVADRTKYWEIFRHCQAIYELRKQVKKVL